MLEIGDVIELIIDLPDHNLRAGLQGTIVHCHTADDYEVEFTNENGETIDFLALNKKQFIAVWRVKTRQWVPLVDRITALIANLPEDRTQEIFDFARFLAVQRQPNLPT